MISPRSYVYSRAPRSSSPSPLSSSPTSPASSPAYAYTSPLAHRLRTEPRQHPHAIAAVAPFTTVDTIPWHIGGAQYEQPDLPANLSTSPVPPPSAPRTSEPPHAGATMGKRKERLEQSALQPAPTPRRGGAADLKLPATPSSSPVQIPRPGNRATAHPQKRHTGHRRAPRHSRTPDDVSPSVAALLAVTDIPRQRSRRGRRSDKPLTVDEVIDDQQASEKELSWSLSRSLSRGPMDLLLSPPEEYGADDDISVSDCNIGSALSTRTVSVDSIPSLGESFATEGLPSLDTPGSPGSSPSFRGRRPSLMRRSLEPVVSPPGKEDQHPLAKKMTAPDEAEAEAAAVTSPPPSPPEESMSMLMGQFKPLKYAFRSNLTASFRALRSAARSFSSINFSSIPPDDLLTRSLLTIDPNVPYADERRPPVTEDVPSAEMRRYLNPTSTSRIESQPAAGPPPTAFSASIQMQTYKVQRSKPGPAGDQKQRWAPRDASPPPRQAQDARGAHSAPPGMRQREMRENSDFIRIAVMEMAMRKRGKLDDQRPGRARWALPPRRTSSAPYEIGPNGVPTRWRSVSP